MYGCLIPFGMEWKSIRFFVILEMRDFLCSPGFLRKCFADQVGLKLRELSVSAPE